MSSEDVKISSESSASDGSSYAYTNINNKLDSHSKMIDLILGVVVVTLFVIWVEISRDSDVHQRLDSMQQEIFSYRKEQLELERIINLEQN